ncbi:MAG TPA: exodeoxyribonuclease V subunit alpha [Fibrobacteria bacterium]|nr:exodeoxyribonuclease V subunit alpha [Fibrobacteria bacterium]
MTDALLDTLRKDERLDAAGARLVAWLRDQAKVADPENREAFILVAAALCRACTEGALCLPLDQGGLGEALRGLLAASQVFDEDGIAARFLKAADDGAFNAVLGSADKPRPLVRAHGNLYLHRFWHAERILATELSARARATHRLSEAAVDAILRETLDDDPLRASDGSALTLAPQQRAALVASLREPVFVLSGGPGTGKTTWTAAWLRALMRLPGVTPERVRLCAPTGRAARRLAESLRERLEGLRNNAADEAARTVPVTTLHGLLGYRAFEGTFARGPGDPIDADWILLDEASMTDVFLLAALLRAMRPGARLVLAGDPDQLPPVEAGSVLAELLPDGESENPVPSVTLDTGHRSKREVAALAAAVRAGDAEAVLAALGSPPSEGAVFDPARPLARIGRPEGKSPLPALMRAYAAATFGSRRRDYDALLERFRRVSRAEEGEVLGLLWKRAGGARVLAPLRRGPVSAEAANRELRALLEPSWRHDRDTRGTGFHGAPILVTRNDDRVGLSNGDVGLWLETGDGAAVFFPDATSPGGWLRIPAALLPPHELGFASTVHKSQGSEYDSVLILLPEAGNALLARETLYTAITRARREARIFGGEDAIREAMGRKLRRPGGLRAALADASRTKPAEG